MKRRAAVGDLAEEMGRRDGHAMTSRKGSKRGTQGVVEGADEEMSWGFTSIRAMTAVAVGDSKTAAVGGATIETVGRRLAGVNRSLPAVKP
jgi:hypothetical protein